MAISERQRLPPLLPAVRVLRYMPLGRFKRQADVGRKEHKHTGSGNGKA